MKCPKCGNELLTGAIVCMKCGTKFVNENDDNNQQNNQQNNQPSFHVPEENKNDKSGIIIIVLFILGAGLLSYFLLFSGGGGSKDNNEESSNKETNTEIQNTELPDNSINNAKKMSYIRTANAYVDSIRNEVNMGKLRFYSVNTIYFVPVGDKTKCGKLETGENSPFSNVWNYAYVGVTYDGVGYSYYFISEDGKNIGIDFTRKNELTEDKIYTDYNNSNITKEISNELKELYSIEENKTFENDINPELKNILTPKENQIENYVFISSKAGCRY